MIAMGDATNRILTPHLTPNFDKQPHFSKQVNYCFVKTSLFFNINSRNLKIFLGSDIAVNMAPNMAFKSMYNYDWSSMYIFQSMP